MRAAFLLIICVASTALACDGLDLKVPSTLNEARAQAGLLRESYQRLTKLGFRQRSREAAALLNAQEVMAIQDYTFGGNQSINRGLRGTKPTEQVRVVAGHINAGLAKLANFEGLTQRGTFLEPGDLEKYKVGAVIQYPAFTSATLLFSEKFVGNIRYFIFSKTGKDIRAVTAFDGDEEVLFRTGARFAVKDRGVALREDGVQITEVLLEEVD